MNLGLSTDELTDGKTAAVEWVPLEIHDVGAMNKGGDHTVG